MTHRELPGGRHRARPEGRRRAAPRRRADPVRSRFSYAIATTALTVLAALIIVSLAPYAETEPAAASVKASGDVGAAEAKASGRPQVDSRAERSAPRVQRGQVVVAEPLADIVPLPGDAGTGRRVVFSESQQRVWLVEADGRVVRSYLVSGSVYDNLDPGTYSVFSRSRYANGIDDSGTMEYFVRFTYGDAGAAIGFHDIPVDDGAEVQTQAELGSPRSHGCIRQRESDALEMWEFAPLGTVVVVTA